MSLAMPTFGPFDAVAGVAYSILHNLTAALAPIDGGAAAALAICIFTAGVRLLLLPLSRRQFAAQQAQARLAPQMQKLRAAHRTDPARLSSELAELYRREGTSPFAAFVPMLLQAPVFIVLYSVFTTPVVGGGPNELLSAELLGVALGAHGLAAGWPLLAVLAGIALVATFSANRVRRAGQPRWLMVLPFITLVPAVIVPLAAGFYLLTTTAWSAVESVVLRRNPPEPAESAESMPG